MTVILVDEDCALLIEHAASDSLRSNNPVLIAPVARIAGETARYLAPEQRRELLKVLSGLHASCWDCWRPVLEELSRG